MNNKKVKWIVVFSCFAIVTSIHANDIKKQWEISFGNGKNQIQLSQDIFYWFDFEVYDGKLFISDIDQKKIKIFDATGKNIKSIKLRVIPEIIKIWDSTLIILTQDGQLGIYNIKWDKLDWVKLKIDIKPYSFSQAFFSDSLLFIPKSDKFVSIRNDSYVIDISKLPKLDISVLMDAYDIEKKIILSDSLFETENNYSVQQGDYCFNSKNFSIIDKHDKNHPGSGENEYILLEKKTNKFKKLGSIPIDTFGLIIHTNTCRGFKVYKDWIYFIGEKYENHIEKSLIISRMPIPQ